MARGERTKVLAKDVKHISVPQFEGLTVETILDYAQMWPGVLKVFPTSQEED